jgi:hypothetical protein
MLAEAQILAQLSVFVLVLFVLLYAGARWYKSSSFTGAFWYKKVTCARCGANTRAAVSVCTLVICAFARILVQKYKY